jgi:hypothetical protein
MHNEKDIVSNSEEVAPQVDSAEDSHIPTQNSTKWKLCVSVCVHTHTHMGQG